MYIYKITNDVNNKVYIGQTIRPIQQRFQRHLNDAQNNVIDTHFARAIRLHGAEHFSIEEIDSATSQEELNEKERYWINFYNSINNGYNETDALYKSGGNTYASKDQEDMNVIKTKIYLSKIGKRNPNARSVKCKNVKTNEEYRFDTCEECRVFFGEKTHRFITTRTNGETRSLYKNEWAIAYEENEYKFEEQVNKTGTRIRVKNTDTNSETEYASVRLASIQLKIVRNRIQRRISDGQRTFTIDNYLFTILD